jgi:predicted dehydrogenase
MTLRVAIVGAGGIARRHARACQEVDGVDLVAVCDLRPEAAERFGDEFGVPGRHASLEPLLAEERLDLAIVSTWGDSHAAVTTALARSGRVRGVLCEKPFSLTAAEAEAMQRAAAAHGVLLAEAFKFRHHPAHLKAAELIAAGCLGELSHVRSLFTTCAPPAARDPDLNWRFNRQRGGGAVYDLACYCTHHARWIMAADPLRVHAVGRWGERSGVDEYVAATLEFPGGRTAQWWVSFGDAPTQEVEVFGTRGRLRIDRAWNNEDQPTTLELVEGDGAAQRLDFPPVFQFSLQLEHMRDCLLTGQPHRIPTADSVAQMRALDAVHASLRSGAAVSLAPALASAP